MLLTGWMSQPEKVFLWQALEGYSVSKDAVVFVIDCVLSSSQLIKQIKQIKPVHVI